MSSIYIFAIVPPEKAEEARKEFEALRQFWSEYNSCYSEANGAIGAMNLIRSECIGEMGNRNLQEFCIRLRAFADKWSAYPKRDHWKPVENEIGFYLG